MSDKPREPFMLNLDVEAVTAPTQMHAAIIGAAMLWPQDIGKGQQALQAWVLDQWIKTDTLPLAQSPDEQRGLIEIARDTKKPESFTSAAHINFRRGIAVGWLIHQAIIEFEKTGKAPFLKPIKTRLIQGGLLGDDVTEKAFDTHILTVFRPVAFLWAGLIALNAERQPPHIFPCIAADIPEMLALSEAFRRRAESIPGRSRWPALLPSGASVRIPLEVVSLLESEINLSVPA